MIEMQHPNVLQTKHMEEDSLLFYRVLRHIMKEQYALTLPEPRLLESQGYFALYLQGWKSLYLFMDRLQFSEQRKKVLFFRRGISLMLQHLKQRGVPLTTYVVISEISKIPALLDAKYPGYQNLGKAGGDLITR